MWDSPVTVTVGEAELLVGIAPPGILHVYQRHADLAEHFADPYDGGYSFVALREDGEWPALVVTQRYEPAGAGFPPGVLYVPEQRQLFIGAGTRLLAYDGRGKGGRWRRTWIDEATVGFWGWRRHGDVVLMSAELELAAWRTDGTKLWTTPVEPPWSYHLEGNKITLGERTFDLSAGP